MQTQSRPKAGDVLTLTVERLPVYAGTTVTSKPRTLRVEVIEVRENDPTAQAAWSALVKQKGTPRGRPRNGWLSLDKHGEPFELTLGKSRYEVHSRKL